jgi:hypothetical protein
VEKAAKSSDLRNPKHLISNLTNMINEQWVESYHENTYQKAHVIFDQGYGNDAGAYQAVQQNANAPSNASTWTGNDVESVASADSYWENGGQRGASHMRPQQQMYVMQDDSHLKNEQGQDQQQYFMPVPMMSTPYGLMPMPGSPMSAQGPGTPMSAQGPGTPMAMSPMGNGQGGMAVMQAVPAQMPGSEARPVGMQMQPMVINGAAPQAMMMAMPQSANGEGVPMMPPGAVMAVIPAGMALPGGMGGAMIPVAMGPQGYAMAKPVQDSPQNKDASPAGDKKARLLEDLLPGGVRRRATREEVGRKVFVGGLNPTTTTEDLRNYFSDFGTVTDSCVITDATSKTSRGFGFVEFEGKIPEGLLEKQHIIDQRRCGVREYGNSSASP